MSNAVRDRLALATAGSSAGYAAVLAYVIRLDIGPPTDSPLDSWGLTVAVLIHVAIVVAWCVRPAISRRLIVGIGVLEIVIGLAAFFTSVVFLGARSMATGPFLTPLQAWAIFGLPICGAVLVLAAIIHGGRAEIGH